MGKKLPHMATAAGRDRGRVRIHSFSLVMRPTILQALASFAHRAWKREPFEQ